MPTSINRAGNQNVSRRRFFGAIFLATMPVFVIFYILLVLPFIPNEGQRLENIFFWPVAAGVTLAIFFANLRRIDRNFFRSGPLICLFAYLAFAATSVAWAYNPGLASSRIIVEVLLVIIVAFPYALPIPTKYTIAGIHLCYASALAVSAVYVLTTPASPIGHSGYFTHKQELGALSAAAIILASHEIFYPGWRRFAGAVTICLGFWLVFKSESKSALAFALVAIPSSALIILLCKRTRLTPAVFVAAVVAFSLLFHSPIERIGYRIFGDYTLTGRTAIWSYANYRISQKPWLGWGFHSYYFVPNSPQKEAPGFIREMPSSHSGYLELKLETGRIGYVIFLIFIYASLHLLERVRRKDPFRAWCYLSIELFAIFINLTDSHWIVLDCVWAAYLFAVVESVHFSTQGHTQESSMVPGGLATSHLIDRSKQRGRLARGGRWDMGKSGNFLTHRLMQQSSHLRRFAHYNERRRMQSLHTKKEQS